MKKQTLTAFILLITIRMIFTYNSSAQSSTLPKGIPFQVVKPCVITDTTKYDTDDPAIWIHPTDRSKSLIIGTDKNADGSLYAFDLNGKIVKVINGLERPNNVDIAYGFSFNGQLIDIAVVTERLRQRIRVFRLPDMELIDRGDLIVFDGDTERAPMGLAIYKRKRDNTFFIMVSGKSGPRQGYIGQYMLEDDGNNNVSIKFVRQFGKFSGRKEIEAIAVDSESGYIYYSDETVGVRKYNADPDVAEPDKELALFATHGFMGDHEGISICHLEDGKGYILVSDQQANQFWIFSREGSPNNPHDHRLLKIIKVAAVESDGSDVTSFSLSPHFPAGLFVAMSNGKTFHYYAWEDIAGDDLKISYPCEYNKAK